jgi:prepilin peptidase CpaA
MPGSIEGVLVGLVIAAGWSDLRTRRIPNWITVPGAALGFGLHAYYGGFHGLLTALAGAALGLGIFVIFYLTGGMGAGDVKLFGAVGALVGPQALVLVFVFTGLLGGIAAAGLAAFRGRLRATLERTRELAVHLGGLRWQEVRATSVAAGPEALRLPYGVVIAGGTLVSLLLLH